AEEAKKEARAEVAAFEVWNWGKRDSGRQAGGGLFSAAVPQAGVGTLCYKAYVFPSWDKCMYWLQVENLVVEPFQAMASRRPNGPTLGKISQFKLVLLGESAVGKSSLVLRFVKGQFHEFQESTIG
ncbi:hypothetical protein E2320_002796, partial [Naja naja]